MSQLFSVYAVDIKSHAERLMKANLDSLDADDYIRYAVFRRGVDKEFFIKKPQPEPA